jgi:DNA-binding NarL/FixJ family response regulator
MNKDVMKSIKIIIVDDHQIILDGLKTMLLNVNHIEICGTYLTGIEALKYALILQPDVIIIDMMMPDLNGLDFIKKLKSYNIKSKILMLSMCMSSNIIYNAIHAGANGFIMKQNATRDEIINAIDLLIKGEECFTSDNLTYRSKTITENTHEDVSFDNLDISVLSKNEFQILQLYVDGLPNKEISNKLMMKVKTIEKHKSNIMIKLNLKSNVDLIKFAIKNNVCYV